MTHRHLNGRHRSKGDRKSKSPTRHSRKYRKHHGDLMDVEWKPQHVEYVGTGPPPRYFPRTHPYVDTPRPPEFPPWNSDESGDDYFPEASPRSVGGCCNPPPIPQAYASPSMLNYSKGRSRTPMGYAGRSFRGRFQLGPVGDWDGVGESPVQRILYARSPISRQSSPVRFGDRTPLTRELLPAQFGRVGRPLEIDERTRLRHFKDVTPKRTPEEPGYRQYPASVTNWPSRIFGAGSSPLTLDSRPASAPSAPQRQQIILIDQWPKPIRRGSHCSSLSGSTRDDTTVEFSAPSGTYEQVFMGYDARYPTAKYDVEAPPLTSSSVHSEQVHAREMPVLPKRSVRESENVKEIPELKFRESERESLFHLSMKADKTPDFLGDSARAGIHVNVAKAAETWAKKEGVIVIAKSSQGALKYMGGFRVRIIEENGDHVLYLEKGDRKKCYPLKDVDAIEALDDCLEKLKSRYPSLKWPEPDEFEARAGRGAASQGGDAGNAREGRPISAEGKNLMLALIFRGHRIPVIFRLKSYQEKAELTALLAACLNRIAAVQDSDGQLRPDHVKLRFVYYLLELPPTYSRAHHVRRSRSPEYRPYVFEQDQQVAAFARLREGPTTG